MNTNEAISKPYEVIAGQCVSPHLMYRRLRENEIKITDWWDYLENADREAVRKVVEATKKAVKRLYEFQNSTAQKLKIRKFVNYYGYSDIRPFEVVKVHSATRVEIRAMSVRQTVKPTLLGIGGFAGVFDNSSQEWEIYSDESNNSSLIFLGKKGWGLGNYRMSDVPVYHYDFNF